MTWVEGADVDRSRPRIGVAIGRHVLDLGPVLRDSLVTEPVLKPFLAIRAAN